MILIVLIIHNVSNGYAFTNKLRVFICFKKEKALPIVFLIFIYNTYNVFTVLFTTSIIYANIFNIDFLVGCIGIALGYIQGLSKSIKDPVTGERKMELLFWIIGLFALASVYKFLPIVNKLLNIIVYSIVEMQIIEEEYDISVIP